MDRPHRAVEWRDRLTTAATAVQLIRPGDRVWAQQGPGTPATLLDALAERGESCGTSRSAT